MINTVAVIGSGTMGRGIAQAAALAGHWVLLYDLTDEIVARGLRTIHHSIEEGLRRGKTTAGDAARATAALSPTTDLAEAARADLVIEAVPEELELKRKLFGRLDAAAAPHTILASTTSSLSISAIAGATHHPARVIGLHFFNPAHLMPLVEIIRGDRTSD